MAKKNPLSDNEKRLNNLALKYEGMLREGTSLYMDPDDLADLCLWYDDNHYHDRADEVMDFAMRTFPDEAMLKIEQAYRYIDKGDLDSAIILANQIKEDETDDLLLLKVRLLIETEEYEKADELLNSIPPDRLNAIMVANMFMEARFPEKAIDWLKRHGQGLEEEEDYLSILMNAYCSSGKYQEAIDICEKLIDTDPFSAHYWLSLGRCYLALGEYNKAVDACDFSITNDEDMGEAYLTRCNLYVLLDNEQKAKENLREAIKLRAVAPSEMNEIDLALLLDQEKAEESIKLMNFYLKHINLTDDQVAITYFRQGVCYASILWFNAALDCFDKVLAIKPNDVEAIIQKAVIYVATENYEMAINQLSIAVEKEPERKYLYRTMGVLALITKNYYGFRKYSALSDEPLSDHEVIEAINIVESDDKNAINLLIDSVRKNLEI